MKNLAICLMIMALFCSCNKKSAEEPNDAPSGVVMSFIINIVIVDDEFQDRLNPESPSYFGEEYIQEIKLFTIDDGKERMIGYHNQVISNRFNEVIPFIQEPCRLYVDKDGVSHQIDNGTLGYYCIPWSFAVSSNDEDGKKYMSIIIRYPDENEDVIKLREYFVQGENGFVWSYDKLWINGELACERIQPEFYYNTKYYPWLIPVLDDDGNQIGNRVMPTSHNVFITR